MTVSSSLPAVIPAAADQLDTIAVLLAHAYYDDPVAVWVAPDSRDRPGLLRRWFTLVIDHALTYGAVDLLADRSAAAVWLDRTQPLPGPLDDEQQVTRACGLAGLDVLMAEHISSRHRLAAAHYHLSLIGVRGQPQRPRLRQLLEHRHALLDDARLPATAEAAGQNHLDVLSTSGYLFAEPYTLPDGPLVRPAIRLPSEPCPPREHGRA